MANPFLALNASNAVTLAGFTVWDEGGTETLESASPVATRVLVCEWTDRVNLAVAIGGGLNPLTGAYTYPIAHPVYPWLFPSTSRWSASPGRTG